MVDTTKITKGEAYLELHENGPYYGNITVRKAPGVIQTISCQLRYAPQEEQKANAELWIQAHNVANETGLSPLQLKQRLEEAVKILQTLVDNPPSNNPTYTHMPTIQARAFLSTQHPDKP